MRLFVGTVLSAGNQSYYRQLAEDLGVRFRGTARAVPAGSMHVTLAFMPQVERTQIDRLASCLKTVASRFEVCHVRFEVPSVLWAGRVPRLVEAPVSTGAAEVMRLVQTIARELHQAVPGLELRPARSAHATLARLRRGASAQDGRAIDAAIEGMVRHDMFDRIALIASELLPAGPSYNTLEQFPLGRDDLRDRTRQRL
jgi:2'-5' RNA ligase